MSSANPVQSHTAKVFHRTGDDEYRISDTRVNKEMVRFDATIIDHMDISFVVKWSDNMPVQFSLLLDVYTDIQGQKQTGILSKIKSAKDNMAKLFKTTCCASPALSTPGPFGVPRVRQHVTMSSLDVYSEHTVGDHFDDFISNSRCAAKAPSLRSLSSPTRLLAVPASEPRLTSTIRLNERPTIEEEVGDIHEFLTTSDSQAKYDAMLAAEFAAFSFNSKDMQEWSDELETKKQARMDVHFAYVSEALAVSVPKLSAFDSPALGDKDESIGDSSPVKTETSASSADVSLVTSDDAEEDRPPFSPIILRGLRSVRDYEDLKNTDDSALQ